MEEDKRNHYQVLGVERTADLRAIKSAYFGLIRKFRPDSHPEEFKRLRAAYETLSDAEAKKRYDDLHQDFREYGDEVGARLKVVEAAFKGGDEERARKELADIVEERPSLAIAREKLGFSYLRTKSFAEALAQFEALSDQHPEDARYLLHQSFALRGLEKLEEAEAALRDAHELEPADIPIHIALVDCLLDRDDLDEALSEIESALRSQSPGTPPFFGLSLKRIDTLFLRNEAGRAQEGLTELLGKVGSDVELRTYVASQLATMAAKLFARKRTNDANAVLARAHELDPNNPVQRPYPHVMALPFASLSDPAKEWILAQKPGPNSPTFPAGHGAGPSLLAFLIAVGFSLVCVTLLFHEPSRWDAGGVAFAALLVGLGVMAPAAGIRALVRSLASPLRGIMTVHALYLVRAVASEVRLWSLFHLRDVNVTHHHVNGVYSHSRVDLHFSGESLSLTLTGAEYAAGWAQFLFDQRMRALELMAEGYLEAEEGVDLFPASTPGNLRGWRFRVGPAERRWYGGAALLALALLLAAIPYNTALADDAAWNTAVLANTPKAYGDYLAASPSGRHAGDAKRAVALRFERAALAFKASADLRRPGAAALLDALSALASQGKGTVPVEVTTTAALPPLAPAIAGDPAAAIASHEDDRSAELVTVLGRVFGAAGLSEAMTLSLVRPNEGTGPVKLLVGATVREGGVPLPIGGSQLLMGLSVEWEAKLVVRGKEAHVFRWTSPAAHDGSSSPFLGTDVSRWATLSYERRVTGALDAFVWALSADLGLDGPAVPARASLILERRLGASNGRPSPYTHREGSGR